MRWAGCPDMDIFSRLRSPKRSVYFYIVGGLLWRPLNLKQIPIFPGCLGASYMRKRRHAKSLRPRDHRRVGGCSRHNRLSPHMLKDGVFA